MRKEAFDGEDIIVNGIEKGDGDQSEDDRAETEDGRAGDDKAYSNSMIQLHEMIKEALKGHGQAQLENLDSGNAKSTTASLLFHAVGIGDDSYNVNMSLGKLYLKFKNLDSRLTRVEEVVMKQREDSGDIAAGRKRATTLSRLSDDPCRSDISNGISTIDPILSITDPYMFMSPTLESFQETQFYPIHQASGPVSNNTTTATIHRKDDIKRFELDHYCLPLLESNPKPTTDLMQDIANNSLSPLYPNVTQKKLLSKVREWFRKRREYMSQRIYQACSEIYKDLRIESESDLDASISQLNQSPNIIDSVLKGSNLEITNEMVAREFCHEKVL